MSLEDRATAGRDSAVPNWLVTTTLVGVPFLATALAILIFSGGTLHLPVAASIFLSEGIFLCFYWRRIKPSAYKSFVAVAYALEQWLIMLLLSGVILSGNTALTDNFCAGVFYGINALTIISGMMLLYAWILGCEKTHQVQSFAFANVGALLVVTLILSVAKSRETMTTLAAHGTQALHQTFVAQNSTPTINTDDHNNPSKSVDNQAPAEANTHAQPQPVSHGVHWGYTGPDGPAYWGNLDTAYATCRDGKQQSPVDIKKAAKTRSGHITTHYGKTEFAVVDNGHTIKVTPSREQRVTIEGKNYKLVQFHIHSPSEHEFNGKLLPMEIHLVHSDANGKIAVLGIMVKKGTHQPEFDKILASIPNTQNQDEKPAGVTIDPNLLLPAKLKAYSYSGSLTTPPCTEGVVWNVLADPIELSARQLTQFKNHYSMNNRPVQPINTRTFRTNH